MCLVQCTECGRDIDHEASVDGRCYDCDVEYKIATGAFK